jgi:hypothetical protein
MKQRASKERAKRVHARVIENRHSFGHENRPLAAKSASASGRTSFFGKVCVARGLLRVGSGGATHRGQRANKE